MLRAGPLGSSKEFVSVQVVLLGRGSQPGWHPEDAGLPPEIEPLQRSELGTAWVRRCSSVCRCSQAEADSFQKLPFSGFSLRASILFPKWGT